ncbi:MULTISPECIES: HAD family hydrolase [unclassified Solwaraspora]|uniref:HAD family hydrolase n=1 Tax=unclassified Solwaraspora TaxID=2627926 RepID=UPI00259B48FD|nr:HAD family hydrolase [Solwaraspora sp. WMMA2056]WJK41068.1 HAD family hydrolase [Solwaraspora sp. WMMA2056]
MITTVVFDVDETLVDLRPAVTGALRTVLAELRQLTPRAADLTLDDMAEDWDLAFAADPSAPVMSIRRAALARSVARVGLPHELDRITDIFFARRFELSRPYADTLPALSQLRRRYAVGLATNGNSRADRCGLRGQFAFEVYAHVDGLPKKPDQRFYGAVLAAAGATRADRVVYVGDSIAHDVVGPQAAGLRAIWLNRRGESCPPQVCPDAQVTTLAQLPDALADLF